MILIQPAFQSVRAKVVAIALGGAVLASGHAAAKNHDLQRVRIPSGPTLTHDRAPGPASRGFN